MQYLCPLSARIWGVCHHTQLVLILRFISFKFYSIRLGVESTKFTTSLGTIVSFRPG